MKQTISARQEGPLLKHAISKLNPEVFSHPVWTRFHHEVRPVSSETIQELLLQSAQLQQDTPFDACQILLVCAVLQNDSDQGSQALLTLQKALELAESARLGDAPLWINWGACAVSLQQGNQEQADLYFRRLQAALNAQNEWMLADYVEVVRQYFLSSGEFDILSYPGSVNSQEFGSLLESTIEWLYHWGYLNEHGNEQRGLNGDMPPFGSTGKYPAQGLQISWRTLKLMFHGELKLQFTNGHPILLKKPGSILESILSTIHLRRPDPNVHAQIINVQPETESSIPAFEKMENSTPPPSHPEQDAVAEDKSGHIQSPSKPILEMISVSIQMLGKFEMSIQDQVCKLPASRSLSLLKYLLLHHRQNTSREVLMDVFWPEATPETARNSLNVAMHSIRNAMRDYIELPAILYKDGAYGISPNLQIWLDVEEFEHLIKAGKRQQEKNKLATAQYESAISIYQGDFLEENIYENWTVLTRESLRISYLNILDSLCQIYFDQQNYAACIPYCQRILARDCCREDTHCMLMQCYSRLGQDHLALRQYQSCAKALRMDLDVAPSPATIQLYQRIRQHKRV